MSQTRRPLSFTAIDGAGKQYTIHVAQNVVTDDRRGGLYALPREMTVDNPSAIACIFWKFSVS